MRRHLPWMVGLFGFVLLLALLDVGETAAQKKSRQTSRRRFSPWRVVFDGKTVEGMPSPNVSFTGVGPILKDPFHIHEYRPDGDWSLSDGLLVPTGKNGLLGLGTAEEFELEGYLSAEGLGGWLLVLGWQPEEQEGFVVYNVTLRESGSPWHLDHVRKGKVTLEDHREVTRFEWKGARRLRVAVIAERLSLAVDEQVLYEAVELPEYRAGIVALGTYDTRYGPKPLRIASLRIRER